jgi:hypothetical protein
MRLIVLLAVALLALNGHAVGQEKAEPSTPSAGRQAKRLPARAEGEVQADETARKGLTGIRSLINEKNFKEFGLQSFEEVSELRLGDAVPIYYVRADQLKEYQPGTDAGKLMISANRRLYPVLVNGQGKLLITIEKAETGWRMVSFGQADVAPALTKIKRDKVARTKTGPGASESNYFVVQIPSMHLNFLAYAPAPGPGGSGESKRQVTLTPLSSSEQLSKSVGFQNSEFLTLNPTFNAEKQGGRSANDVFKTLSPNAATAMNAAAPQ